MKKKDIKILLVDDEPDVIEIIRYNLDQEGYKLYTASNGKEDVEKAKKKIQHLIIKDVRRTKRDGIEAWEEWRKDDRVKDTIIRLLTARGEDWSKVAGVDGVREEWENRPIKPTVIVSKVKALLRRLKKEEQTQEKIQIGKLIIDREQYEVTHMDKSFSMPRKEFELLYLLASNPDKVVKRDKIMEIVWGSEVVVGERTIDVHIRKLREKVGDKDLNTGKGAG